MERTKTNIQSNLAPCISSKRRGGNAKSIISCNACTAWVIFYLLTLQQYSHAFSPSLKRQKPPSYNKSLLKDTLKSLVIRDQINDNLHSQSEINEQFCVDEYLKSIDRRYRRLHQSEFNDERSEGGVTNAWTWLFADKAFLEKEKGEDDALYVLGLAKLASARLLQHHHSPIMQLYELSHRATDLITIDINSEKDTMKTLSMQGTVHMVKKCVQSFLSIRKASTYRYDIASLQLRAWFYDTLRCTGSALAKFLVSLNLFQSTKGGKITGQVAALFLATIAACTSVVTKPFND